MKKKRRPKGKLPRIRTQSVDFMRVEHARGGETLTQFELLVQMELGMSPSASDLLIKGEKEKESERREVVYKEVLEKLKLTAHQRRCFEQTVIQGVTVAEFARRLGISRRTVRTIVKRIERRLVKMVSRFMEGQRLKNNPRLRLLSSHERKLFNLYYEELLGIIDIARQLGIARQTVHEALTVISKHKLKFYP